MANQRRSGGTQKITVPLADEHSIRNAPRGILDIYNEDYASRLFQDQSIPAIKVIGLDPGGGGIPGATSYFIAKINQSGESEPPTVTIVQNTTEYTISLVGTLGIGRYFITFSGDIFDSTNVIFLSTNFAGNNEWLIHYEVSLFDTLALYSSEIGASWVDDAFVDASLMIIFF